MAAAQSDELRVRLCVWTNVLEPQSITSPPLLRVTYWCACIFNIARVLLMGNDSSCLHVFIWMDLDKHRALIYYLDSVITFNITCAAEGTRHCLVNKLNVGTIQHASNQVVDRTFNHHQLFKVWFSKQTVEPTSIFIRRSWSSPDSFIPRIFSAPCRTRNVKIQYLTNFRASWYQISSGRSTHP